MKTNLEMEMPLFFFKRLISDSCTFVQNQSVQHLEQELNHTLQAQRIIFNTLHQKII